jgi:hypothetical protein
MKLVSAGLGCVELRVLGYQFETVEPDEDEWLVIRGDVRASDGREWSFTDPCLTVSEARALGDWFGEVAAGAVAPVAFEEMVEGYSDSRLFGCIEPNLAFSVEALSGDRVSVRVHLSVESAPPWLPRPSYFEYFVLVNLGREELRRLAVDWSAELATVLCRRRRSSPEQLPGE